MIYVSLFRSQKGAANYWVKHRCPKHKLLIGLAGYGRSFTLTNPDEHGLNAPVLKQGAPGPITKALGVMSYYEVS